MSGFDDPYVYPGTGVLKNKLNIRDQQKLGLAEDRRAGVRYATLLDDLPKPPFTFDTLEDIHRTLFQDVYNWAGTPRSIRMGKPEFDVPGSRISWFAPPEQIERRGEATFERLAQAQFLTNLDRPNFAAASAGLLADINQLHPFREGNGRSQRLLLAAIGQNAGHPMTFDVVTRERMIATSIEAARGDPSGLVRLIEDVTDPRRADALRKALDAMRQHSTMDWNNLYVATTQAGQTYRGILAGQAGPDFMMRVDEKTRGWIAIGDVRDLPEGARNGQPVTITATRFAGQTSPAAAVDAVWTAITTSPAASVTDQPMLSANRLRDFEARMEAERKRSPPALAEKPTDSSSQEAAKPRPRSGPGF